MKTAAPAYVYDPGSGSGAGAKTIYQVFSRVTGGLVYRDEVTDGETTDYASVGGAALRLKKAGATLTPEYTHFDHQGSAVAATNASGAILWRERYSPWGTRLLKPAGNKGDTGYTGHLMDAATELVYMQARYYDSQIQRFYSTDPVGYEDQLNLYAYVGNDPVNKTDPTGMCSTGSRLGENSGCKIDFDSAVAEKNAEARANSDFAAGNHPTQQNEGGRNSPLSLAGQALPIIAGTAVADGPEPGPADLAALAMTAVVGSAILTEAIHANDSRSMRGTEVYNLINRTSGAIDKIGITSNASTRYSQAYLRDENVTYVRVAEYQSRYAARVHENISLVHYAIQHGDLPRLNKVPY